MRTIRAMRNDKEYGAKTISQAEAHAVGSGAKVYIYGKDQGSMNDAAKYAEAHGSNKLSDAIKRGASRYDSKVEVHFGRGKFIEPASYEGTDREQRDSARKVYETYIDQSPVSGSKEIWAGIRDRWGASLKIAKLRARAQALRELIDKFDPCGRQQTGRSIETALTIIVSDGQRQKP